MTATGNMIRRPDCSAAAALRRLSAAAVVTFAASMLDVRSAAASDFVTFSRSASAPSGPVRGVTLDGAPLTIAADPEKTVLVHFFASWCEPCEEELPSLAAFVRARPDTVRLVGVNVAEPASRARTFGARFDLPGDVALDEGKEVAQAFGVRGLPATVMISPDGTKAMAAAGPVDWNAASTLEALNSLTR